MASVTLEHVSKSYGPVQVIADLNLEIRDEEFMVLVGPSGCGKSTALRMVAGLEEITGGTISIGDRVVNDVRPKDRDIAMVFQSYALYPHMSVRENLQFGLKIRKMPAEEIRQRVEEAAEILGLTGLLDRKPRQLSGGQRQRVAVGRAIVRKPRVFLFDEPLSNLDAKLRVQMRAEITKLQRRLKTTTIYVTHDQVEAMTMGHRVAVLKDGDLQQVGTPLELYDQPSNVFVAQFIGTPPMNFFSATLGDGGKTLQGPGFNLPVPEKYRAAATQRNGQELLVGVRPENLLGEGAPTRGATGTIPADVEIVEPLGHEIIVHCKVGDLMMAAKLDPHRMPGAGEHLDLVAELDSLHLFDTETELRLNTE
ncbi:MAG: sn-glycerol-3-phosphate ABC transporter ATP-binding protein UgpC [Acidobacteriota bacterium]|nr:sn-glycerol-3-phosphate ABC transporter ATP-binding protein UgpC [Acidobacteriota bacterium]